jgi:hypothetical protein
MNLGRISAKFLRGDAITGNPARDQFSISILRQTTQLKPAKTIRNVLKTSARSAQELSIPPQTLESSRFTDAPKMRWTDIGHLFQPTQTKKQWKITRSIGAASLSQMSA